MVETKGDEDLVGRRSSGHDAVHEKLEKGLFGVGRISPYCFRDQERLVAGSRGDEVWVGKTRSFHFPDQDELVVGSREGEGLGTPCLR